MMMALMGSATIKFILGSARHFSRINVPEFVFIARIPIIRS
ncbi:protein of unknown function [Candidatus Nitrosotalea okcheonensis]|uniref:Uncharacterized protein n=1 Tax=Candidatus Nitrosotalea okcheonensis TaxID=1903276 RepID=A0A2H1FHI6_9ARCH|nr:protein of unknown function [Candidatus Nitrosotalea okcheonensis]